MLNIACRTAWLLPLLLASPAFGDPPGGWVDQKLAQPVVDARDLAETLRAQIAAAREALKAGDLQKKESVDRDLCTQVKTLKGTIGNVTLTVQNIGHNLGDEVVQSGQAMAQASKSIPGFCAHFLPGQKAADEKSYETLERKVDGLDRSAASFMGALHNMPPERRATVEALWMRNYMKWWTARPSPRPSQPPSK